MERKSGQVNGIFQVTIILDEVILVLEIWFWITKTYRRYYGGKEKEDINLEGLV